MKDIVLLIPEILISLTIVGIVISEIGYHKERYRMITLTALFGLAGAFVQTLLSYREIPVEIFSKIIVVDGISLFFKLFFISLAALNIIALSRSTEISNSKRTEYIVHILGIILVMCVLASTTHLLMMFVALSGVLILSALLIAHGKSNDEKLKTEEESKLAIYNTESSIKYLVGSLLCLVFFLLAAVCIYAKTGEMHFAEIREGLIHSPPGNSVLSVVLVFMVLSISFLMALFPMHLWFPDVMHGAPTVVSGFLAVGIRSVGITLLIRILFGIFSEKMSPEALLAWKPLLGTEWTMLVSVVAGITMLFGAFMAIIQTSAKRLFSYLLLSQSGFLLLGLLVQDEMGMAATLYSLWVELFSVAGLFFVLGYIRDALKTEKLEHMQGLIWRSLPESVSLILFISCLVGIPPLPGFFVRFSMIYSVVRHEQFALALVSVVACAISVIAAGKFVYALVGKDSDGNVGFSVQQPKVFLISDHAHLFVYILPLLVTGLMANVMLHWVFASLHKVFW